jgi:hypothetical protein
MTTFCSVTDEKLGRCWGPAGHSGEHEFENASVRCKECGHLDASHSPGGDCPVPTIDRVERDELPYNVAPWEGG